MRNFNPTPKFQPLKVVLDRVSLSRSTVYASVARGDFPKPVRLSTNRVAWASNDIDAWIAAKIEGGVK